VAEVFDALRSTAYERDDVLDDLSRMRINHLGWDRLEARDTRQRELVASGEIDIDLVPAPSNRFPLAGEGMQLETTDFPLWQAYKVLAITETDDDAASSIHLESKTILARPDVEGRHFRHVQPSSSTQGHPAGWGTQFEPACPGVADHRPDWSGRHPARLDGPPRDRLDVGSLAGRALDDVDGDTTGRGNLDLHVSVSVSVDVEATVEAEALVKVHYIGLV